jgi:hypothetical protein
MLDFPTALCLNVAFRSLPKAMPVSVNAVLQVPLDFILGITGSIGVCQLSFTIPAIFYFKMFDDKPGFKRMLTIPLFIFGIAATVISFYCNMLPYF